MRSQSLPCGRGPPCVPRSARGGDRRLGSLVHTERLAPRRSVIEPFTDLPRSSGAVELLGIHGLYPHQRRALDLLTSGSNVVLSTGTASGKTLVYNAAFAAEVLADPKRTALYLFPTKALARTSCGRSGPCACRRSGRRSTTATRRRPSGPWSAGTRTWC